MLTSESDLLPSASILQPTDDQTRTYSLSVHIDSLEHAQTVPLPSLRAFISQSMDFSRGLSRSQSMLAYGACSFKMTFHLSSPQAAYLPWGSALCKTAPYFFSRYHSLHEKVFCSLVHAIVTLQVQQKGRLSFIPSRDLMAA